MAMAHYPNAYYVHSYPPAPAVPASASVWPTLQPPVQQPTPPVQPQSHQEVAEERELNAALEESREYQMVIQLSRQEAARRDAAPAHRVSRRASADKRKGKERVQEGAAAARTGTADMYGRHRAAPGKAVTKFDTNCSSAASNNRASKRSMNRHDRTSDGSDWETVTDNVQKDFLKRREVLQGQVAATWSAQQEAVAASKVPYDECVKLWFKVTSQAKQCEQLGRRQPPVPVIPELQPFALRARRVAESPPGSIEEAEVMSLERQLANLRQELELMFAAYNGIAKATRQLRAMDQHQSTILGAVATAAPSPQSSLDASEQLVLELMRQHEAQLQTMRSDMDVAKELQAKVQGEEDRALSDAERLRAELFFTCPACMEDLSMEDAFRLSKCGHMACFECVSNHTKAQVEEGHVPVPCFEFECDQVMSQRDALDVIPNPDHYFEAERTAFKVSCPGMQQCHAPDCRAMVDCSDPDIDTFLCSFDPTHPRWCLKCTRVHPGLTCEQAHESLAEANLTDADLRAQGMVRCPGCRAGIQKSGGCNKMTCSQCGHKVCYHCGIAIKDYSHFEGGNCPLHGN